MADKLYRVTFRAAPILVHAPDEKYALKVALEYAQQPDTKRIEVELVAKEVWTDEPS